MPMHTWHADRRDRVAARELNDRFGSAPDLADIAKRTFADRSKQDDRGATTSHAQPEVLALAGECDGRSRTDFIRRNVRLSGPCCPVYGL